MLEKIGKYKIIGKIGSGFLGLVYKGFDTEVGRYVAVKVIDSRYTDTRDKRVAFMKEAIPPAKLFHPNIVTIYDLDEEKESVFIVMEHLDGLDLKYFSSSGIRFSIPQVLNILIQVADGLDYAHHSGVVHYNIAPGNIFLTKSGTVKILELGAASFAEKTGSNAEDWPQAALSYRSPEKAEGRPSDHRSDQYSLGLVAHELIARKPPIDADGVPEASADVQGSSGPALAVAADCPKDVASLVQRATSKSPDDRFPDMRSFAEACRRAMGRFASDEIRLEQAVDRAGSPASLDEPYEIRLIRKYIREKQPDAADQLLGKIPSGQLDASLLAGLHADLAQLRTNGRCDALAEIGNAMMEKGDLDLALANFNEMLVLNPDNVAAVTYIQRVRRLKKDQLFRSRIEPILHRAAACGLSGQYMEAADLYRSILELDPDFKEVRGLIEENERRLARENNVRQLVDAVRHAVRLRKLPEAMARYLELETFAPEDRRTSESRGKIWRQFLSDLAVASAAASRRLGLHSFRQWLSDVPGSQPFQSFFADTSRRDERNTLLQELKKMLSDWLNDRKWPVAEAALEQFLALFPGQGGLAAITDELDRLKKASHDENMSRKADQDRKIAAEIQNLQEKIDAGRVDDAGREFQALSQQYPNDRSVAAFKAEMEATLQRDEEEARIRSRVEQLKNLVEAGDPDRAEIQYQSFATTYPGRPETSVLRALLDERRETILRENEIRRLENEAGQLLDVGRFDQAVELAKKAVQRYPDHVEFLHLLASSQKTKADHERQQEIGQEIQEIRNFVEKRQFLKAGKAAFALKSRFPEEGRVEEALRQFIGERQRHVRTAVNSTKTFLANREFAEAKLILNRVLDECPDVLDIKDAIREVESAEEIRAVLDDAESHFKRKRYDLAVATLESLAVKYPETEVIQRTLVEYGEARSTFVRDSVRSADAFLNVDDFDRALNILRAAAELVPNSEAIRTRIHDVTRLRADNSRRKKAETNEEKTIEGEIDRALNESRKLQNKGLLFEALHELEECRRRLPRSDVRLNSVIREMQDLIDYKRKAVQPETGPARSRRGLPLAWAAACALALAVVAAAWFFSTSGALDGPRVVRPALLTIDLRPWGRVDEIVQQDTDRKIWFSKDDNPLTVSLHPGLYRVVYLFADTPGKIFSEIVDLKPGDNVVLKKKSPTSENVGHAPGESDENDRDPATLVVDIRPWGKVVEIVRQDSGERLQLEDLVTPLRVSVSPGLYRVVFTLSDVPGKEFSEILQIEPGEFRLLKKMSPTLEKNLDQAVERVVSSP